MKHPVRHYLSKFKYFIALAIFIISIGFVGDNCILQRIKHKQEIADLEHGIAEQKQIFSTDSTTLASLKNDVDALRTVAREEYYMKQADEDVFIIKDPDEEMEVSMDIAED